MSQSQKKIKILFVITQGEMGGAQRYVYDLAVKLDHERYEIMVGVGAENNNLRDLLRAKNTATASLKYLRRNIHPLSELAAIWELKNLIQNYQPDIIHLNSSKAGVLGSLAARLARNKNVVFTAHGFAFLEPHMFHFLYFWAEKLATKFRKKIITVSEHDRQEAIKNNLCEPEKLITIHNGIAASVIASDSEAILKNNEIAAASTPRNDSEIVIGTIAYDYPTKDLNTLRRAFKIVKQDYPEAKLKIVSGAPDASSMLSGFTIYACSSVKEGLPYTILEAMRAGLPIVSTNVGGIPEAITDGREGLLVKPRDSRALASAIKKLIADKQLAEKLGRAAREKVQQFTLEKMLADTESVYKALV